MTDALRTPTHKLAASAATGRAAADLVFTDAQAARTRFRTCVRRRDVAPARRTCFALTTGPAGAATVTPLRFPPGRYAVRWSVGGEVVARWRFVVAPAPDA
ncbi:MAG TPA: hypothetical protein VF250_13595 [Conexibacter sp.]